MTMAVYVYELKEKFILTIVFIYDGCIREWQWQCHSPWLKEKFILTITFIYDGC